MIKRFFVIIFSWLLLLASSYCVADSPENKDLYLINIGGKWESESDCFIGGKYGFIDRTGKIVVPPIFENAEPFSEGLAAVKNDQNWGYIDRTGKMVIASKGAGKFSEGLAAVRIGKEFQREWGYIDRTGKIVIEPQFGYAGTFVNGFAQIHNGTLYGYVNTVGKIIAPPQFNDAEDFSEGMASVRIGEKWGFIDQTGTLVIAPQFEATLDFSEHVAAVKIGEKFGFIDRTGKFVIASEFDFAGNFSEGLAAVEINGKWGYLDQTGKMIIPPQFESAYPYSEGVAIIEMDGYGLIDRKGNYIVPPEFDNYIVEPFAEGLAVVWNGLKRGYIDKTGKISVPPQFDEAWPFSGDLAAVKINEQIGYIDRTGRLVIIQGVRHHIDALLDGEGNVVYWSESDAPQIIDAIKKATSAKELFAIASQFETTTPQFAKAAYHEILDRFSNGDETDRAVVALEKLGDRTASNTMAREELTLEQAEKALLDYFKFPRPAITEFPIFDTWDHIYELGGGKQAFNALFENGLVASWEAKHKIPTLETDIVQITLSSQAEQYVVSKPHATRENRLSFLDEWFGKDITSMAVDVKTCDIHFHSVLRSFPFENETGKSVTIDFEWGYKNPTPFLAYAEDVCEDMNKGHLGGVIFELYHDGWRMKIESLPYELRKQKEIYP